MTFRYPPAILFLLCLFGFPNAPARAQNGLCNITGGVHPNIKTSIQVVPTATETWPVGWWRGEKSSVSNQKIYCTNRTTLRLVVTDDSHLIPIGNNRYKSAIAGTELRIEFGYGADYSGGVFPGWERAWQSGETALVPGKILLQLIRTGSYVPRSGKTGPIYYKAAIMDGTEVVQRFTIDTSGIELVNNYYLMSCTADQKVVQVPMGATTLSSLRANASPIRNYDLNVTCEDGPTGKPPVKVYFVGKTEATDAGILSVSGPPDSATGVGIAVSSADGKKLPFNRTQALDMTWIEKVNGVDRYRFQGRAQYVAVPGAGEPRPGRADATMTYVLDYN